MNVRIVYPFSRHDPRTDQTDHFEAEKTVELPEVSVPFKATIYIGETALDSFDLSRLVWDQREDGFLLRLTGRGFGFHPNTDNPKPDQRLYALLTGADALGRITTPWEIREVDGWHIRRASR